MLCALKFKNVCLNVNYTVNSLVKGTLGVLSSDPPIVDWCFRFTTVPFNPLTAQGLFLWIRKKLVMVQGGTLDFQAIYYLRSIKVLKVAAANY